MVGILSEGLTMRPPTMDDLELVHELTYAYDLVQYGEEDFSLNDIRTTWTSPDYNAERDERLIFDQHGQLVARLRMGNNKKVKFFVTVILRPGYSNQQVSDYLLKLAESWARERMFEAPPEARVTMSSWIYSLDQEKRASYERAGFKEIRRSWRMEIELDEVPAIPDWPQGVTLRPFVPGRDDRAVFDALDSAFRDHWGYMPEDFDDWRHWTSERDDFDPTLWFVACEGEQIAGTSLCVPMGKGGWVDTLGVLRPWRRKGLGLALLLHSFGEFYRRGWRWAGLGVDSQNLTGATRLYRRAGMHKAREHITYEKELRAGIELSTQTLAV